MSLRCQLHCHSNFSHDSNLSIETVIASCEQFGISVIALTDHNTIEGSLELKQKAPDWLEVIVAEEIATEVGDVIGLFLTKNRKHCL